MSRSRADGGGRVLKTRQRIILDNGREEEKMDDFLGNARKRERTMLKVESS